MNHLIEKPWNVSANERRSQLERIARDAPPKRSPATLDAKAQMQLPSLLKPAPDLKLPVLKRLVLKAVRAVRSDYLRRHAGSRKGRFSGEMRLLSKREPWIECNDQLHALERASGELARSVYDLRHMAKTQLSRAGASWEYLETLALGSCAGNAVRLAAAGNTLALCEGIETALSRQQMYGDPIWAACGSNMAGVVVPDSVKRVIVYADNGNAGERAAKKAAAHFHRQGRSVTIVRPIDGYDDFNTYLQAQAGSEAA